MSQTLTDKKPLLYTIVKNTPRVLLPNSEAEKNKHESLCFVILSFSSSLINLFGCSLIMQKEKLILLNDIINTPLLFPQFEKGERTLVPF